MNHHNHSSSSLSAVRERCEVASKDAVEALSDIAEVISIVMVEFKNPADKAHLLAAIEAVMAVATEHDLMGGYRICDTFGAESGAERSLA
jgi:hypothetical protein